MCWELEWLSSVNTPSPFQDAMIRLWPLWPQRRPSLVHSAQSEVQELTRIVDPGTAFCTNSFRCSGVSRRSASLRLRSMFRPVAAVPSKVELKCTPHSSRYTFCAQAQQLPAPVSGNMEA